MFIINVNVTGTPTPKVQWLYKDSPISSAAKAKIDTKENYTTLQVKGADTSDGGKYKLVAENKVGTAEAEFTVVMLGKPSAPESLKVTEVSKDFVTLTWTEPESDGGSPITGMLLAYV